MTTAVIVVLLIAILAFFFLRPKKGATIEPKVVQSLATTKVEQLEQTSDATTKIEYVSNGPSGYIVYKEMDTSFKLYYEFGGGNCVASISLPQDWEGETQTNITDRNRILDLIAKKVIADKAPNSYAEIVDGRWLNILKRDL